MSFSRSSPTVPIPISLWSWEPYGEVISHSPSHPPHSGVTSCLALVNSSKGKSLLIGSFIGPAKPLCLDNRLLAPYHKTFLQDYFPWSYFHSPNFYPFNKNLKECKLGSYTSPKIKKKKFFWGEGSTGSGAPGLLLGSELRNYSRLCFGDHIGCQK